MTKHILSRFFTVKTLIRAVVFLLSLSGIAHAEISGKALPQQGGSNYMAGGGG